MEFDVAFALLPKAVELDPVALVANAAGRGVTLRPRPGDDVLAFDVEGGGEIVVRVVDAPHGEAPRLPPGPISPSPDEIAAATAHVVVAMRHLPAAVRERDLVASIILAAVVELTGAVGAILPPVPAVHRASTFLELVTIGARSREVAPHLLLAVAGTIRPASEDGGDDGEERLGLLTQGMFRYGREELLVTSPTDGIAGAVAFVYDIAEWLLSEPAPKVKSHEALVHGEVEVIVVRVPHPRREGATVLQFDLDEAVAPVAPA